jgi:nitrite reductase/ring-hydroxylating ferredoxin subunit
MKMPRKKYTAFNAGRMVLLAVLLVFILASCKKDKGPQIPNVYVNLNLDISSTLYIELNSVGGWVNITGGYKGITVYRSSIDEFVAFERCCSYDPDVNAARVVVDTSGLTLTDAVCGSQFLILDGSVVTGPATAPLLQYRADFDGDNLHIYNN